MIIRLRSRDGLERIEVKDDATVGDLKHAIEQKLNIPYEDVFLSKDAALLTAKDLAPFKDLKELRATLKSKGVQHGDLLYLLYHFEREVEPVYKKSAFESRRFGEHTTMAAISAKQTRIERQDKAHVESVSFDRSAADVFQSYIKAALAFSIKRGGLLYGSVDESKNVKVEVIYEPPQEGTADTLLLHRNSPEEQQADFIAELLGLKKVGWLFSCSSKERDFITSTAEIKQMAAMQDELGPSSVTVIVTYDATDGGGHVHFEAFQCTEQCVKLCKEGWLKDQDTPSGVTKMVNPNEKGVDLPVIVAGKDVDEVDNDWFLCPCKILQHEGPLTTSFPVENRLLPQGKAELREHLRKGASRSYVERLSDFHLLLWLAKQPNLDTHDMLLLCEAVREHKPVMEGYRVIIDSIAGI